MKSYFPIIFLSLIILSCRSETLQAVTPFSANTIIPPTASKIPVPTSTRPASRIPKATLEAQATERAFEDLCDQFQSTGGNEVTVSPNGQWVAIICGAKKNQALIVQSHDGVKWVLNFSDFLTTSSYEEMLGRFVPMAWSSDGRFLYFSKSLGYSGGGNQCFPGHGVYGLYRLQLTTGTVTALINSDDDRFPGDEIRFSPNNEYFAVDINGVQITNLTSGKVIVINRPGIMEMHWSPDGNFLAFSVASCGEEFMEESSILVWDSSTKETKLLFSTQEMLLRPTEWIDNSTIRFEGESWVGIDNIYTIFEYNLTKDQMMLSGTATPGP